MSKFCLYIEGEIHESGKLFFSWWLIIPGNWPKQTSFVCLSSLKKTKHWSEAVLWMKKHTVELKTEHSFSEFFSFFFQLMRTQNRRVNDAHAGGFVTSECSLTQRPWWTGDPCEKSHMQIDEIPLALFFHCAKKEKIRATVGDKP